MASSEASPAELAARRQLAQYAAWARGDLRFLLHDDQLRVYRQIQQTADERFVMEIARKWGKTWLLCALMLEPCLQEPETRTVLGGPSLKHLEEFIHPVMREISAFAAPGMAPVWKDKASHYFFPHNGSWVHIFAADDMNKATKGRGPKAKRAGFDEAAFTPVLRYVLDEVFRPSLLLEKGKRITILGSTPAEEPDHEFTRICEVEEAAGNYAHRTIRNNPMLTEAEIEAFLRENARQAGVPYELYLKSDSCRREYFAERVVNKTLLGVPEWPDMRDASLKKGAELRGKRPKLFRGHATVDFGGNDPHAGLWGYWHLEHGLVLEAELLLKNDERSGQLSEELKAVEQELYKSELEGFEVWDGTLAALTAENVASYFGGNIPHWLRKEIDRSARPQPYLRLCDHDMELARHLHDVGYAVVPVKKGTTKQLMVQDFRNFVAGGHLALPPELVDTDRHLRTTTWENEKREAWGHRGSEHGDLLDCAIYMVRGLVRDVPVEDKPKSVLQQLREQRDAARQQSKAAELFFGNTRLGKRLAKGHRQ